MKLRRSLCLIFIIALIGSIFLSSCGVTDYTKKSITFSTTADIKTLDPQLASTSGEITAVINLFDGLMKQGEDGKPKPAAAQSYKVSDDRLTYTFTLCENMLWATDDEENKVYVTADDFVFGLTRAVLPETKAPFVGLLYSIKNAKSIASGKMSPNKLGVVAKDSKTVEITLNRPDHNFLKTLCHAVAMPCNKAFFDSTNGKYGLDGDSVLCNGAYYLKKWNNEDNYLSLSRFSEYNGEKALPASVSLLFSRDYQTISDSLSSDDINMGILSGDYASTLDDGYKKQTFYNTSYVMLFSKNMPKKLRRALMIDTNLEAIQLNLPEYYDKSASLIPISAVEGDENYRKTAGELKLADYDQKTAQKLMKEIKSESESPLEYSDYTLYYPSGDNDVKKSAGLIVSQWQNELNAFINAEETDADTILQKLQSGEINAAIVPITTVTGTAYDSLETLSMLGFSDFNSKLANISDDISKCCEQMKSAEQSLIDDYYALPLFCEPEFCCMSDSVNNAIFSASGSYVDFSSIKKEDN